ncbi:phosphonate metabolism protein/1,5-bisphosphokinase (PRPP-forming) PhnN [archaeon]|nr:phosphonate metabolism protein/1,5-bisphosphokinase (PRPP-forming) PhnN [archaeon]
MGRLFLIVGPSGSGKDTLIKYSTRRIPGLKKVKRVITRENNEHEDFKSVNREEFSNNNFFTSWEAHGNKYGIPTLNNDNYILNVSRKVINKIKEKKPDTFVIELSADKEVLRKRLIERGRDSPEEITKRLNREIRINSDFIINTNNPDVSIAGEELVNYIKKKIIH